MVSPAIAWANLEPIQRAQLLHFCPQLREEYCVCFLRCKHCGGNLYQDDGEIKCLLCGREHNTDGELAPAYRDPEINLMKIPKRKGMSIA